MAKPCAALMLALVLAACGGGGQTEGTAPAAKNMRDGSVAAARQSSAAVVTTDMTLDWAEYFFPNQFPQGTAIRLPAVVYMGVAYNARLYAGVWGERYLGITADGRIFGLGDFTGGTLQQFNDVQYWAPQVLAAQCRTGSQDCLNSAPVADAGLAQDVAAGAVVTLTGAASSDVNGDSLRYVWILTSKPEGSAAALTDAAAVAPSFVADKPGSYVATLVVSDGKLTSAATTVTVSATGPAAPAGIPDSGITASQCYAAGSSVLVSCSSAAAVALNEQQDGMVGRDASEPDSADGKLGLSYTKLDAAGNPLPPSAPAWTCVKDNITGLTWEIKTADLGLRDVTRTYTNYGDNRSGDASDFAATANAAGLCGHADWRVPTVYELQAIVDYSVPAPGPTIDGAWFVNTVSDFYWSSSAFAGDPAGSAWAVGFHCGVVGVCSRSSRRAVRLVRSDALPLQDRYTYSGDGTEVTDRQTGLVWRRCAEGTTWNGSTCTGSATIYTHEAALTRAKSQTGWRLPNVKELFSIVDISRMNPATDPVAFPATPAEWHWTSTPYAGDSFYAWVVGFQYGLVQSGHRSGAFNSGGTKADYVTVRLVR